MAASASSLVKSRLIVRGLYRSLLRASTPFTKSKDAVILNCLLDRTGFYDWEDENMRDVYDDEEWLDDVHDGDEHGYSADGFINKARALFRRLIREVVAGSRTGERQMQFPQHVVMGEGTNGIRNIIQREFRNGRKFNKQQYKNGRDDDHQSCATTTYTSQPFTDSVRRQVAFMAFRCLNEKVGWYQDLVQSAPVQPHPRQAALHVTPMPIGRIQRQLPSSYLQAGVYLVAHPKMNGYFRRTVVCILEHQNDNDNDLPRRATYGLVINRIFPNQQTGGNMTLQDTFPSLPDDFVEAFGHCTVRDGGPVHASLQMLHSVSPEKEESLKLGGHVLSMAIAPYDDDDDKAQNDNDNINTEQSRSSAAGGAAVEYSIDNAVNFAGDIRNAAAAAMPGHLDPETDLRFFSGNSGWVRGQLEREIEQGSWIPCRGPPDIAYWGSCEHAAADDVAANIEDINDSTTEKNTEPLDDLWLSMMSACGEENARLAHLLWKDDGLHTYGRPCDKDDELDDFHVA